MHTYCVKRQRSCVATENCCPAPSKSYPLRLIYVPFACSLPLDRRLLSLDHLCRRCARIWATCMSRTRPRHCRQHWNILRSRHGRRRWLSSSTRTSHGLACEYREISTTVCLSLVVSLILADHGLACSKYTCPLTGLPAPYPGPRTHVPFANVRVHEELTHILSP